MAHNAWYFHSFMTEACEVFLVGSNDGLHILHLETGEGKAKLSIKDDWIKDDDRFTDVKQQVIEYFAGKRKHFELTTPLKPIGTEFQQKVWKALADIPVGSTCRYMDIAEQINNTKAVRAVGAAIGNNPIAVLIPCHRVIGSNGQLTGFAHGLEMKKKLLTIEGVTFKS